MKAIIKYSLTALTVFILAMQSGGQSLPTPGAPPSLNPTVPSNPPGLPPNSNFPPNNVNPPGLPGTTGNVTPPEVPKMPSGPSTPNNNNSIKTLPGSTGNTNPTSPTPGAPGPTGPKYNESTEPHGLLLHSCNGSCNQVNNGQVIEAVR